MMNSPNEMLAQYREADFNARLNLYLQHPALRDEFMATDQAELRGQVDGSYGLFRNSPGMSLVTLLVSPILGIRRLITSAKF